MIKNEHWSESIVKLTRLIINRLHGHYNYDVKFNPDVTFIYGLNGCGKTTVLNITEAIITGEIYKLFEYEFENIILEYRSNEKKIKESIFIDRFEDHLTVVFEGVTYKIKNDKYNAREDKREVPSSYFREYPFLMNIADRFNYVYLPLNRNSTFYRNVRSRNYINRYFHRRIENTESGPFSINNDRDMELVRVLILNAYREMMSDISILDEKFRKEILISSVNIIEDSFDIEKVLETYFNNRQKLREAKKQYLTILHDLELITLEQEKILNNFFDETEKEMSGNENFKISTILRLSEIVRMMRLSKYANDYAKNKDEIRKPLNDFLNIMNDFVKNSEDGKEIMIDKMGQVYFTTKNNPNRPIEISKLSSGEKQLITFFANLMFSVRKGKAGIFVVDEPEVSLHLAWQRIFVDKIIKSNSDLQLIFATHSPEIVEKRRDKMFRLKKEYIE